MSAPALQVSTASKRCPRCTRFLPLDDFARSKGRSDGRNGWCKPCTSAYLNNGRKRGYRLRDSYGLTSQQYDAMLAKQRGLCAACGGLPGKSSRTRKLAVDHDHATGRVRGLLCHRCNTALGLLREDLDRITRLWKYLDAALDADPDARRRHDLVSR